MSSYDEEALKRETEQQQEGVEAYLSQDERTQLQRYLSFPEEFPRKFGAWIQDYLAVNGLIGTSQVTGLRTISASAGMINMFAAPTPPEGWLLCDGTAVARDTYANLFSIISTIYGVGDGSTTFNLPDLRGRVAVGQGTHADVDALSDNEGEAVGNRRPKHKHTLNDPGHIHSLNAEHSFGAGSHVANITPVQLGTGNTQANPTMNSNTTGISVGPQTNIPTDAPAYLVLHYIIKT